MPAGQATGTVTIAGHGREVTVNVEAFNPAEVTRETLAGFAEGQGVVSIEPEHFTKRTDAGENRWMKVSDYGRTLSGMRAEGPVDAPSADARQGLAVSRVSDVFVHDRAGRGDRRSRRRR